MQQLPQNWKERFIFSKEKRTSQIWSVEDLNYIGGVLFSFDKKTIYNFWEDYPDNLTHEQKALFDKEFPYWKNFYEGKS